MNVLPDVTTRSVHHDVPLRGRATASSSGPISTTARPRSSGISVPLLKEDARFRVAHLALDLRLGGAKLYSPSAARGGSPTSRRSTWRRATPALLGHIPEQMVRYPMSIANGLAFVSVRLASDLIVRKPNGALVNVTKNGHVWDGNRCGRDFIVSRGGGADEQIVIERLDAAGRRIEQLTDGPRPTGHPPARPTARPGSTGRTCRARASGGAIGPAARRSTGVSRSGSRRRRTADGWRSSRGQAWIDRSVDQRRWRRAARRRRDRDVVPRRAGRRPTRSGCRAGAATGSCGPKSMPIPAAQPAGPRRAATTAPTPGPIPRPRPIPTCASSTTRRRSSG